MRPSGGRPLPRGSGSRRERLTSSVSARRISLWRTPRSRSLLLVGALAALTGAVALAAHVYTDALWFKEVGHEDVFWATLRWKVLGRGIAGFGTACFLLANFAAVERAMAAHAPQRPARVVAYAAAAVAAGVISSERAEGAWRLLALWAGRSDFGVDDPLFGRDVSFFVFSLPLYEWASRWLLDTLVMAAVATVAAYAVAGGLRIARPRVLVPGARAHLLVLGALALVVVAWRYRLDQYALALPHGRVSGAGYTEAHVRLPALRILTYISLAGAALLLYAAVRRLPRRPLAAVVTIAALALASPGVVSRLVERIEVAPQVLTRERPYLANAIAATRRAYALDGVNMRSATGGGRLSRRELEKNQSTVENLPLWDASVLRPALDDLQSIGRYYSFRSLTVDRYMVAGSQRVVTLAARHVDLRALGPDVRSWANDRFAYTHGYGVVAVSGRQADAVGQPRFAEGDFGTRPDLLDLREPRVYFSERVGPGPPYLVLDSRRAEVDRPRPGSSAPDNHYGGAGGIPLSSPLRRAAFAIRFGDPRLLLTETATENSRIVLHRGIRDRLQRLAPFLRWDSDPQTAVIDGRVQFLFHGYTTSGHFPYSAPVRMGPDDVNYVRAPVVAAVDGFDGSVRLYADDSEEPILRAWRTAFPGLFQPFSEMPAGLREHLRYPRRLFAAQTEMYATYHADDPTAFWNGADAWQRPQQIAGPLEDAGEIRFPDEGEDEDRWEMPPRYLLARLPGDTHEQFVLVTPFTPRGRQNLVSYLAGTIDSDGRPALTLLSLPRDRLELGPAQATRRILASSHVSDRLQIVNRESRDLGEDSVSRTILGAPRVVPLGDALVHVQPVYLTAGGSGVPRLQLVTVLANGRVGYGRDLESALRRAIRRR
jgi:uncharacterized protein